MGSRWRIISGFVCFLFSGKGRIGRTEYCLSLLSLFGVLGLTLLAADAIGRAPNPYLRLASQAAFFTLMAIAAIGLFAMNAIGVKRLHDRGNSGSWLWVFYCLPALLVEGDVEWGWDRRAALVAILSWSVFELGCRRGTIGPNRYGPEPGPRSERVDTPTFC